MTISVPATSANLGPGFDTLGVAIDLRNRVKITRANFFSISIKGEGENRLSLKKNNQFINIFYNFYTKLVGKKDDFRFEFDNSIPLSRGLGSSSAMIISAISSAYEMANVKLSKSSILDKALFYEPHPDNIAPAVHGGFTASLVVKNKRVITQKAQMPSNVKAVVVIPNKAMSTQKSRAKLPKNISMQKAIFNISHSSVMSAAFFNQDWEVLRYASWDKLHQNIRMNAMRELFNVQKVALENGSLMSTLSGSGSSFFNMVYEDDAKRLQEKLKSSFPMFRVEVFNFDNDGLKVEKS